MIVTCNYTACPYHSQNNFCRRRVVSIVAGGCDYLQKGLRKEEPLYFDNYIIYSLDVTYICSSSNSVGGLCVRGLAPPAPLRNRRFASLTICFLGGTKERIERR